MVPMESRKNYDAVATAMRDYDNANGKTVPQLYWGATSPVAKTTSEIVKARPQDGQRQNNPGIDGASPC
jgi:hypothetical protein